jgi:Universal stress protein family
VVAWRAEVAQLQDEGVDVVLRVMNPRRRGVAEEIVRAAEIHHVDVIVCGTRGFGAAARGGTVARRLPQLAPCPVLLVSERAAELSRHVDPHVERIDVSAERLNDWIHRGEVTRRHRTYFPGYSTHPERSRAPEFRIARSTPG